MFACYNFLEMLNQHRLLDAAQIEPLTARENRDRHFADFRRRENELHMARRLFERLQQRIKRALREHVNFVDDEDFGAGNERHVLRAFDDLADVVDAGVRRRVHFEHVRVAPFHDLSAMTAKPRHIDQRFVDTGSFIVQGARQDAGCRCFANAAHAGQHVALRDTARREGVLQRRHHRVLADQVFEGFWAVFAREHDIGLGGTGRARLFVVR